MKLAAFSILGHPKVVLVKKEPFNGTLMELYQMVVYLPRF